MLGKRLKQSLFYLEFIIDLDCNANDNKIVESWGGNTIMNHLFKTSADLQIPFDFSVIDFETATNEMNSACSIGIACVTNNQIVYEFYSLIKPKILTVDPKNFEIHGISVNELREAPTFKVIWDDVQKIIQRSKYVVAHNAQFDMSVLYETSKAYQIEIDNFQYLDSINLCNYYTNGAGNGLNAIASYFEVSNSQHHNALNDALTAANCVIKAVCKSSYKNFVEFVNKDYNVRIKQFKELKSNKYFGANRFNSVKVNQIETANTNFDEKHAFFGKVIVATGEFENYSRAQMLQAIVDVGGVVKNNVNKKTDYLIVGKQDKSIVGEDGLSGKQEKAIALIADGCNITILNEIEFVSYLSN